MALTKKVLMLFIAIFLPLGYASAYTPSDPMFWLQDYLTQIGADKAWDISQGNNVIVAVLDSGVDIDHPDLRNNIWTNSDEMPGDNVDNDRNGYVDDVNGWDFSANINNPRPKLDKGYIKDAVNHGTAISGLIAAGSNDTGIVGTAFKSKIMPLKVFNGKGEGEVENLIKAIEYAVNNGAVIINLSLVGTEPTIELKNALTTARARGVFVAVASGNGKDGVGIDLDAVPTYPASYGNVDDRLVTTVSTIDGLGKKSSFANYGSSVSVSAPGEGISSLSFYNGDTFNEYYSYGWRGTSFSTALVSGAAALLKSKYNGASPAQISQILTTTSKSTPDFLSEKIGGKLDINAAMLAAPTYLAYSAKLKDFPAVYYIDGNVRRLYPSEAVYWTSHSGSWKDQNVRIIPQAEFDNLMVGSNMTAKEGSIIKFENSDNLYSVALGATICKADGVESGKSIIINSAFESDYIKKSGCIIN